MDDLFYLDWNKHILFGWEDKKSKQIIESIILGIELNDKFPEVHVYPVDENTFSIVGAYWVKTKKRTIKDGGHSRSKAHLLTDTKLLCKKIKNRPYVMPGYFDPYGTIKIQDIILIDDIESYLGKKEIFPNYRELF